jgi:hypothetical protein
LFKSSQVVLDNVNEARIVKYVFIFLALRNRISKIMPYFSGSSVVRRHSCPSRTENRVAEQGNLVCDTKRRWLPMLPH